MNRSLDNESKPAPGRRTGVKTITVIVAVLSLLTWIFFYMEGYPLGPRDTTVVVFAFGICVTSASWLLSKLRSRSAHRGGK
jgi:hypothetical protein